jgi:aryl-alcohol dehydrogenase-like predicted oxidoreductase
MGADLVRRIWLPGLEAETSCLGFGCASLGSRVSGHHGRASLARALDAGVSWFDVAPAYGGGKAEALLGEFLRGRRQDVRICTKVGLKSPPASLMRKLALPFARTVLSLAPRLRSRARRAPSARNTSVLLSPETINISIAESLKYLRTDYLDVFALHMPRPELLLRDDILKTLELIVTRGQARAIAVAGDETAAIAAVSTGAPIGIIQVADDSKSPAIPRIAREGQHRKFGFVTHSIFGVDAALTAARASLRSDQTKLERLRELGYDYKDDSFVEQILLDRAFASNPSGVVLLSMFDPSHLNFNVKRASSPISPNSITAAEILWS